MLLFDIDGVVRDVSASYRRAIQETVAYFCAVRPEIETIDALKSEGCWNNDWDASLELVRRHKDQADSVLRLPKRSEVVDVFSRFYFGGDPNGKPSFWQGFIRNEALLVDKNFFQELRLCGWDWGFVSGAEPPSARFVLEQRIGLQAPPLIAMGEVPDKPDPTGLIQLTDRLMANRSDQPIHENQTRVAYLGDTVADVMTVQAARERRPDILWLSLGVAPPHLWNNQKSRSSYERDLVKAGADRILSSTQELLDVHEQLEWPN